jgi:retinol dehydrogenase-12
VTGGNAGIGVELVKILYAYNATVYVAGRSEPRCLAAIEAIKGQYPQSSGTLHFLRLDLSDLSTIKASADRFLSQETRLDVLWNNAGVMIPPQGSLSVQRYELQLGTNCLGPFLFTRFLTPLLCETAKKAPASTVRVVWLSSSAAARSSPPGGVEMENLSYERDEGEWYKYGLSKAGNILYGTEFAKRFSETGVLSVVSGIPILHTKFLTST